jgi:hypothetical protein
MAAVESEVPAEAKPVEAKQACSVKSTAKNPYITGNAATAGKLGSPGKGKHMGTLKSLGLLHELSVSVWFVSRDP